MAPPKKQDFTDSDRAALDHARKELDLHQHRVWLFAMLGRVAKWTLAAIAGVTVVADAAQRLWKALQ